MGKFGIVAGLWAQIMQECVAGMTCLYKNNGAVSCVGADFLSQQYQERMSACADVTLYRIYWWAVSNTNYSTFLLQAAKTSIMCQCPPKWPVKTELGNIHMCEE